MENRYFAPQGIITSQEFWNSVYKRKKREQADGTTKPGDTDRNYMDFMCFGVLGIPNMVINEYDMSDHD